MILHHDASMGLYILGIGLLAEELSAITKDMNQPVEAFVENLDRDKNGSTLCGRPVLWLDRLPQGTPAPDAAGSTARAPRLDTPVTPKHRGARGHGPRPGVGATRSPP